MTTTNVAVSVVLLALGVGVALPVLMQAFITLRTANRLMTSLDRRLDAALGDLSRVVGRLEPASDHREVASLIGAAVVPALVAAVRALRHHGPSAARAEGANGAPSDGTAAP